jgi:hypothetical protein
MKVDRYRVNDALSGLAAECGVTLDDDTLNELTHHVADVLEQEDEADHAVMCPKHGGVWGDDITCTLCTSDEEVRAETADNEERGDICMALREAGAPMAADEAGGMTVEDAREVYRQVTGKEWSK